MLDIGLTLVKAKAFWLKNDCKANGISFPEPQS
jgi:hypothetical protein